MRRIKRFSTRRSELLFRTVAILLPLISAIMMLSQTAFAQNTYVITDGDRVLVHTTYATDPETVLDEAGLALDDDDIYTTQGGDGVSEITVQRSQTVHINHCGQELTVDSHTETVEALLDRLNVELDENTTVSVPLDTLTYDGMELTITRTVHTTQTYSKSVPYETSYCEDPSLPEGTQVVITEGQYGEMLCTANVVYQNGEQTSSTVVREILVKQPSNEVIAVGTGTEEETEPVLETAAEEIESDSQAPIIGDGTITTATGEVLTYTGTMQVTATGYNKSNEGCDDYTATGTLARVGAIAVDPDMIPYGTRMFIVSNDGEYVYGIATAEDCGGSIVGNRIDLYFDTNAECFEFGVRDCTVYFLG